MDDFDEISSKELAHPSITLVPGKGSAENFFGVYMNRKLVGHIVKDADDHWRASSTRRDSGSPFFPTLESAVSFIVLGRVSREDIFIPENDEQAEEYKDLFTPSSAAIPESRVRWWSVYMRGWKFNTEKEARDKVFQRLQHFDTETWSELFGKEGEDKNRWFANKIPVYQDKRGKWHIGRPLGAFVIRSQWSDDNRLKPKYLSSLKQRRVQEYLSNMTSDFSDGTNGEPSAPAPYRGPESQVGLPDYKYYERIKARHKKRALKNVKEGRQSYRVKPGKKYWFEYRCWESPDSADAELWYHSHQQVDVLKREEPGYGKDEDERAYEGQPAVYEVIFKDGFKGTAMEDELLDSPEHYINADPPKKPKVQETRLSSQEMAILKKAHRTKHRRRLREVQNEFDEVGGYNVRPPFAEWMAKKTDWASPDLDWYTASSSKLVGQTRSYASVNVRQAADEENIWITLDWGYEPKNLTGNFPHGGTNQFVYISSHADLEAISNDCKAFIDAGVKANPQEMERLTSLIGQRIYSANRDRIGYAAASKLKEASEEFEEVGGYGYGIPENWVPGVVFDGLEIAPIACFNDAWVQVPFGTPDSVEDRATKYDDLSLVKWWVFGHAKGKGLFELIHFDTREQAEEAVRQYCQKHGIGYFVDIEESASEIVNFFLESEDEDLTKEVMPDIRLEPSSSFNQGVNVYVGTTGQWLGTVYKSEDDEIMRLLLPDRPWIAFPLVSRRGCITHWGSREAAIKALLGYKNETESQQTVSENEEDYDDLVKSVSGETSLTLEEFARAYEAIPVRTEGNAFQKYCFRPRDSQKLFNILVERDIEGTENLWTLAHPESSVFYFVPGYHPPISARDRGLVWGYFLTEIKSTGENQIRVDSSDSALIEDYPP